MAIDQRAGGTVLCVRQAARISIEGLGEDLPLLRPHLANGDRLDGLDRPAPLVLELDGEQRTPNSSKMRRAAIARRGSSGSPKKIVAENGGWSSRAWKVRRSSSLTSGRAMRSSRFQCRSSITSTEGITFCPRASASSEQ